MTYMFLKLWKETKAPGVNPHRHGEDIQTPHRRAPARWNDLLLTLADFGNTNPRW